MSSTSLSLNEDCTGPDYKECTFSTPHITPSSSSASFTSCTFASLTANGNGGAIYSASSGTLSIISSLFTHCSTTVGIAMYNGGGAVCVESPSFICTSNLFLSCSSHYCGGAILAERSCASSDISLCTFINCKGSHGGGLMTFLGPSSYVSSTCFISCIGEYVGGGIYHDSFTNVQHCIINCLFTKNSAKYGNSSDSYQTRGGGAFEDFRSFNYTSQYSFSFFSRNTAPTGVGDDISIYCYELCTENIFYCFTTNIKHSLWNKQYEDYEDWLDIRTLLSLNTLEQRTHYVDICTHTSSSITHSTETFYGILCSGLTSKTKHSFTSYNSSVTDCVKDSYIISSSPFISSNPNCPDLLIENQHYTQYKCDNILTNHSFLHCSWDNSPRASNGGAIHLLCNSPQPLIYLTVDDCDFFHCKESGSVIGGAIFAKYIGVVVVENSLFYDCACGVGISVSEGAGVFLYFLTSYPFLKSCSFLSCTSADDGGGSGICTCNSFLTYAVDSCNFINCKATHPQSGQGGGISIGDNKVFVSCCNCLFCACEAKLEGGGLWIDCVHASTDKKISFCFFSDNKSGGPVDICFYMFSPVYEIVQHCFSSSSGTKIMVYDSAINYDHWLL